MLEIFKTQKRKVKEAAMAREARVKELTTKSRRDRKINIADLPIGTQFTAFLMEHPQMDWDDARVRTNDKRKIGVVVVDPDKGIAKAVSDSDQTQYRGNNTVFEYGDTVRFSERELVQGAQITLEYVKRGERGVFTSSFKLKQVNLPQYKTDMFPSKIPPPDAL
jgi:hypothetical protein